MYRSIVTLLEDSAFSEHTLSLALRIASLPGEDVRLAHIHAPVVALTYPAEYMAFDAALALS
jgi:hypothetical protein